MRHSWFYLFVCFALLLGPLTACTSSQPSIQDGRSSHPQLRRVEQGMSPDDVRTIMGTPAETIRTNGEVQWMVYGDAPHHLRIFFRENRVAAVPRRMTSVRDSSVAP